MTDYKTILGVLAVVIGFIGYAPYFRDIFRGKTKPHVFSWLVWSILTAIGFLAQITRDAGAGAWVTGFTALICFIIAGLAFKYGEKEITKVDWLCFIGALLGVVFWVITSNPATAVIIITITDAVAFFPTFRKTYYKPDEETLFEYAFASLKSLIGVFALSSFNLTTALYPASLVVMNGAFVIMAVYRRRSIGFKQNIVIGKGNLAGKGVYANRDFKKEEVVIQYQLKPLTKEEYTLLPESEKMFTHTHRGQIYLYSEPERYVNHSDNPNTYQDLVKQCDIALRDIEKGEMITTDATKDDIQ